MEVTEEGMEAVPITVESITLDGLSIGRQFLADRPFLFFIQHGKTGAILFCGRFCSPWRGGGDAPVILTALPDVWKS